MGAELRSWFLRDLVDCLLKLRPNVSREQLCVRLPERLRCYVDTDLLNDHDPAATVPLDDAEELLLALDLAVGDGSGRALEDACTDLVARGIVRGVVPLQHGDFIASCQRLQAVIERPFVNATPFFVLEPSELGFSLSVGIVGRPRSARVLRHWALGALRATARFVQEARRGELRLYADTVGDRANIMGRFARNPSSELPPAPSEPPLRAPTRRPSRSVRPSAQFGLSAEVDRILASAALGRGAQEIAARQRNSDLDGALRAPRVPGTDVSEPSDVESPAGTEPAVLDGAEAPAASTTDAPIEDASPVDGSE